MNENLIHKALKELEGDSGYATAKLYINEVGEIPESVTQEFIVIARSGYMVDDDSRSIIVEKEYSRPHRFGRVNVCSKQFIPFSHILRIVLESEPEEVEA